MNISDIRTVVTVYRELSFTKAAQRLYVTQSAVSQAVARLEKELGLSLFIRTNSLIEPTDACRTFVATGTEVLRQYDKLCQEMKQKAQPDSRRLRIGTASFFFKFLTYQNEIILKNNHLSDSLEVTVDDSLNIENMVLSGQADFCFTRMPLYNKSLVYEPLFTETIMLALPASHPICQKYPLPADKRFTTLDLKELADESFVIVNNPRITPQCMKMCEEAGFTPKCTFHPVAWEHVYASVEAGCGAGFISCLHMDQSKRGQSLRFFRIDSPYAQLEHVVAYVSKAHLSPNALLYISTLREYIQKRLPL